MLFRAARTLWPQKSAADARGMGVAWFCFLMGALTTLEMLVLAQL